jgi:membrane-associated phospholipid phosphatase
MKKLWVICTACVLVCASMYAQTDSTQGTTQNNITDTTPDIRLQPQPLPQERPAQVYTLKPAVDIPITAVGTAWSLYAFTKIYSKDPSTDEQILSLRKSDVNGFDRWAIRPFHDRADKISYYPFYAAMPMPLFFLLDNKMRKDFFKLSFLYLEAMSITGLLYTGSTYFNDRYRPYAYDERTDFNYRMRGGAKNSFYAGHVALVATSTFFYAQVYADYHPESKIKWLFYGLAGAATGFTAYTRYYSGQHFPSDFVVGLSQGILTGLLVPKLHKTKLIKNNNISLRPFAGLNNGLSVVYKFK